MNRKQYSKGFTLIELLVVVGIIALLISILLPSLGRARELSRRAACRANCNSVGKACFIYQEDNLGIFPTAPHVVHQDANPMTEYMGTMGGTGSVARDVESVHGETVDVSLSRSLWLLVRQGSIVPKNFICPSSSDVADPTVDVTTYFDFVGFGSFSYGYQVPYDSANPSKPSVDTDPRMALIADRGPWSVRGALVAPFDDPLSLAAGYAPDSTHASATMSTLWTGLTQLDGSEPFLTDRSPPELWLPFNSPNHGGQQQGEGQSVLYPDMHVDFASRPTAGVDKDNIYTQMGPGSGYDEFDMYLYWGQAAPPSGVDTGGDGSGYYPGKDSLAADFDSSTDSLLWP